MSTYRVTATRRIGAPAKIAYDIIADYRHGHTLIIPPKVFQNLQVTSGGFGAGTTICFDVRAFGSTKTLHATVTEPTPGRVLVETDLDAGVVTSFTVEPAADGRECDVTITTDFRGRDGLLGTIEQGLAKPFLRRAFAAELDRLDAVSRSRAHSSGPAAA